MILETAGPDLTAPEWNVLLQILRRPQPNLQGLHTKGMTTARATAYLNGLQRFADQAEVTMQNRLREEPRRG